MPDFRNKSKEEIKAFWESEEGQKLSKEITDNLEKRRLAREKERIEELNRSRCTCCPIHNKRKP